MKRFLILFMLCVCVTTTFSAWGKPSQIEFKKNDEPLDTEQNRDLAPTVDDLGNNVTYSFKSGNSNACYVNKASQSDKPSTFWFCGKESTKCNTYAWSWRDKKIPLVSGQYFNHEGNNYYCCNGDASKAGVFRKYSSSEVFPKPSTKEKPVGGGTCIQKTSINACGTESVEIDCDAPTKCPSGTVIQNKKCLSPCPSGQHFESATSDKCVADKLNCSATQEEHNGHCAEKCTGGKIFESPTSDKCICGSGMVEIGGVCQTKKTCGGDEDYIEATNECKTKVVEQENNNNNGDTPPAEVTYETLFNISNSCYVRIPSDNSAKELLWCGKKSSNKCGDYKESDMDWSEKQDGDATDDNYCCCGGSETKTGEFRKCTTPGTRTYNKPVSGGFCQQTLTVDSCNRETILEDCNTPDPRLSMQGKTPIAKSNMADCGLCSSKDDFKTCVLNSCYKLDANAKACSSKLKKSCSIKK